MKCSEEVITTFMARMSIEHKDGLVSPWFEVAHEYHFDLPGLYRAYTLLAFPCRDGSYRAKVSITGNFLDGEGFKVTGESSSTRVDCERAEPIT
ncbi:hypothetical protein [Nonomuraea sp. NPDC050643]|uniref:hypothetical protein n=1 Tax=Nonomuraea sp. NPDC050643 TaxID=3155660 RepID=UPI003409B12F